MLLLWTYRILVCVGVCMSRAEECVYLNACVCISMCCMCIWEMLQAKRGSKRPTLPCRVKRRWQRDRAKEWVGKSHILAHIGEERERAVCGCVRRQELVLLCIISRSYGATNEAGKSLIHPLALALAWQHRDMTSYFFSAGKKRLKRKENGNACRLNERDVSDYVIPQWMQFM